MPDTCTLHRCDHRSFLIDGVEMVGCVYCLLEFGVDGMKRQTAPPVATPDAFNPSLEDVFYDQCIVAGLPEPAREYRFDHRRRWRFDFAWPDRMLAVEIEGGHWGIGRHQRPVGFEKDCEKYNEATLAGWRVLRVTSTMVHDGRAIEAAQKGLTC